VARPDPASEIRLVSLRSLRGANFWSRLPVTRLDLAVGAYDEINSADVPGFTEGLVRAFPGLIEHRCSIGERGGFITRLRRGTYAPHIIEHIALELQGVIGHDVGYGRSRGGDRPGEYTVVFEHLHAEAGLRSAALALEIVQRAFAGGLEEVEYALVELRALAETPDVPPLRARVLCGITGGGNRAAAREELLRGGLTDEDLIVDVPPAYILNAGLPYGHSTIAIILDPHPTDVPERYQDPELAERLVSVVADAVDRDGIVVAPAKAWEVQDAARDAGCRVAIFATDDNVTARDARVARAVARVRDGRIRIEWDDDPEDAGPLRPDTPAAPQVAAALALRSLATLSPTRNLDAERPRQHVA
jgi:cyanophycin synthetase